jgi:hypothetical protein
MSPRLAYILQLVNFLDQRKLLLIRHLVFKSIVPTNFSRRLVSALVIHAPGFVFEYSVMVSLRDESNGTVSYGSHTVVQCLVILRQR